MFDTIKTLVGNTGCLHKLRAENKVLKDRVAELEGTIAMLNDCYETLSKKYFAKLAEIPGRYPAVDKHMAASGSPDNCQDGRAGPRCQS